MEFDRSLFDDTDTVTPVEQFPEMFGYEEARGFLWNSPESQYILGVDSHGEPVRVDLSCDTPHMLVSAGSGAGKSTIARSIATQALVKGAEVVFLDIKRVSHRWAKNLPGVTYASEIHEIASVLVSIAAEQQRRYKIIDDFPGPVEEAPVGPRVVIEVEELNVMMHALKGLEKGIGEGRYLPSQAFAALVNLGRAALINMLAFGQYLNYEALPVALRESFGYRMLLRFNFNSWNLMVPHAVQKCPRAPREPGRGVTYTGDEVVKTQFLYLTEEECAELVRVAHDARVRTGLYQEPTPKERKALEKARRRELEALGA